MSVRDNLFDCSVCWENPGIVLASGEQGVPNLMDIVVALTSVGDIWSRLLSGGTNHGAGAGDAAAGRNN